VAEMAEIIQNCKINDELRFSTLRMIIRERLSDNHVVVDLDYSMDDHYNVIERVLLSYIELFTKAYVTMFLLEEGQLDEIGSSEAQQHLSFQ
jgi:hypothetical protein